MILRIGIIKKDKKKVCKFMILRSYIINFFVKQKSTVKVNMKKGGEYVIYFDKVLNKGLLCKCLGIKPSLIAKGCTEMSRQNCQWLCPIGKHCDIGKKPQEGVSYQAMTTHCWQHSMNGDDMRVLKYRFIVKGKGMACGKKICRKNRHGWTGANAAWAHMITCKTELIMLRGQTKYPPWYNTAKKDRKQRKGNKNTVKEWTNKQKKEQKDREEVQKLRSIKPFEAAQPFTSDESESEIESEIESESESESESE